MYVCEEGTAHAAAQTVSLSHSVNSKKKKGKQIRPVGIYSEGQTKLGFMGH